LAGFDATFRFHPADHELLDALMGLFRTEGVGLGAAVPV